jgi:hypothetical protein
MSKRRLGNQIDRLSEAVLEDLEPDKRLRIMLEAWANGNEQWTDRLVETCPQYEYKATDYAFTERARLVQQILFQAVYELHTTYLHYELTRQKQRDTWLLDHEREEDLSDEELNRASARAHAELELFAALYCSYHAHCRFGSEILDVDLEMWLALHPEGEMVFEMVAETIDDQTLIELAASHLSDLLDGEDIAAERTTNDDGSTILDRMAKERYEGLASIWEETLAEVPD